MIPLIGHIYLKRRSCNRSTLTEAFPDITVLKRISLNPCTYRSGIWSFITSDSANPDPAVFKYIVLNLGTDIGPMYRKVNRSDIRNPIKHRILHAKTDFCRRECRTCLCNNSHSIVAILKFTLIHCYRTIFSVNHPS